MEELKEGWGVRVAKQNCNDKSAFVSLKTVFCCLGKPSLKKNKKKMTFVISGLTPTPPILKKDDELFFFLVLDHIWVTFGKNYFLPLENCKTLVKICKIGKILAKMPENG